VLSKKVWAGRLAERANKLKPSPKERQGRKKEKKSVETGGDWGGKVAWHRHGGEILGKNREASQGKREVRRKGH